MIVPLLEKVWRKIGPVPLLNDVVIIIHYRRKVAVGIRYSIFEIEVLLDRVIKAKKRNFLSFRYTWWRGVLHISKFMKLLPAG